MHYMPDTEDEDSAAETFWPEGYKQVIREDARQVISTKLQGNKRLSRIYQKQYAEKFSSYDQFLDKIADMVVISAENGADDAFDEIMDAFMEEDALPDIRKYTSYFKPEIISKTVRENLRKIIIDEYNEDNVYKYAYMAGYQNDYGEFEKFLNQVAELVILGAMNGADSMLEHIYSSFINLSPLVTARRHPRRLKTW